MVIDCYLNNNKKKIPEKKIVMHSFNNQNDFITVFGYFLN